MSDPGREEGEEAPRCRDRLAIRSIQAVEQEKGGAPMVDGWSQTLPATAL